jgi:hypothetical protein
MLFLIKSGAALTFFFPIGKKITIATHNGEASLPPLTMGNPHETGGGYWSSPIMFHIVGSSELSARVYN